jgi:hypothetical protein
MSSNPTPESQNLASADTTSLIVEELHSLTDRRFAE